MRKCAWYVTWRKHGQIVHKNNANYVFFDYTEEILLKQLLLGCMRNFVFFVVSKVLCFVFFLQQATNTFKLRKILILKKKV